MRRIALLLMVMASTFLAASGVAWAATKTCPPAPKNCNGTSGADVLKSTSKDNVMVGKGGNDTYTNFVKGNSGNDLIFDSGGKDKLLLTNYSKVAGAEALDTNKNGKADTYVIYLDSKGNNAVVIVGFFDDKKSIPKKPKTWRTGIGYIESIQLKK